MIVYIKALKDNIYVNGMIYIFLGIIEIQFLLHMVYSMVTLHLYDYFCHLFI